MSNSVRALVALLASLLAAAVVVPPAATSAPADPDRAAGAYRYISVAGIAYVREIGTGRIVTMMQRTSTAPGVRVAAHTWRLDVDRDQVAEFLVQRKRSQARLYDLRGGGTRPVDCDGVRTTWNRAKDKTTVDVPVRCLGRGDNRPRVVSARATTYVTIRDDGQVTCDQETFRRQGYYGHVRQGDSRTVYPRRLRVAPSPAGRGC